MSFLTNQQIWYIRITVQFSMYNQISVKLCVVDCFNLYCVYFLFLRDTHKSVICIFNWNSENDSIWNICYYEGWLLLIQYSGITALSTILLRILASGSFKKSIHHLICILLNIGTCHLAAISKKSACIQYLVFG